MSTPRCLRTAIETCRQCKVWTLALPMTTAAKSLLQARLIQRLTASSIELSLIFLQYPSLPFHTRSSQAQARRLRPFSSSTPRCLPAKDITAGFPTPEVGSRKIQGLDEDHDGSLPSFDAEDMTPPERPSANATAGEVDEIEHTTPPPASQEISPSSTTKAKRSHPIAQGIVDAASQEGPHARTPAPPPRPSSNTTSVQPTADYKPTEVPSDILDSLNPEKVNVPPNVLAAFRTAVRHPPTHGIPVASLQLRSYSVRNLEFFADFAVRAAYWLNLPLSGPVPLPKIIERWTVPKSPFIFKKSKENFERITRRRLLTVYDGDPSVVETWLAFIRKWQFYGVGMKANVWSFEGLGKHYRLCAAPHFLLHYCFPVPEY